MKHTAFPYRIFPLLLVLILFSASAQAAPRADFFGIKLGESLDSVQRRCWYKRLPFRPIREQGTRLMLAYEITGSLEADKDIVLTRVFYAAGKLMRIEAHFADASIPAFHRKVAETAASYDFTFKTLDEAEVLRWLARAELPDRNFCAEITYVPEKGAAALAIYERAAPAAAYPRLQASLAFSR